MQASQNQRARLPTRALAGLLVPVALAAASLLLAWAAAAPIDAVRAPGPASVDALVSLVAALACAALLALAAVGATLTLVAAVTGGLAGRWARLAQAVTPQVLRAAVSLLVGATVVGGQASAQASPMTGAAQARLVTTAAQPVGLARGATAAVAMPTAGPAASPRLPPGWSADRPAAAVPRLASRRNQPPRHVVPIVPEHAVDHPAGGPIRRATIVVRRGDTLWDLAAHRLGPGATDAQVASEWPRWQAFNRATIGPDPDLILPGQRLRVPASGHPADAAASTAPIDREESP